MPENKGVGLDIQRSGGVFAQTYGIRITRGILNGSRGVTTMILLHSGSYNNMMSYGTHCTTLESIKYNEQGLIINNNPI